MTEPRATAAGDQGVTVRDGWVAGLLAGATVAVVFLIVDLAAGEPFATPRFLAGILLNGGAEAGTGLVAVFTVLHFLAFGLLGAIVVQLCRWAELPYNVFLGGVYGLFVCTLLFYLSLLLSGADVLNGPGWPEVVAGNFLAGLVMGVYLHAKSPAPGLTGIWAHFREHPILREGTTAGLIGAVAVAAWFLVVDLAAGRPLFTPAALGSAFFFGAEGPEGIRVAAGPVLAYTLLHLSAFLAFGLAVASLVAQAEKHPSFIFALVILFAVFEVVFIGFSATLGSWILREIAWWYVLVGNLVAAASMGGYLWKAHPTLEEQIRSGAVWAE